MEGVSGHKPLRSENMSLVRRPRPRHIEALPAEGQKRVGAYAGIPVPNASRRSPRPRN